MDVNDVTFTRQSAITRVIVWFLWHNVIHWIKSNPASHPQNQKEKKHTHSHTKWLSFTINTHRELNEQLFHKHVIIQLT